MTSARALGAMAGAGLLLSVAYPAVAQTALADVCLEVAPGTLSDTEWSALPTPISAALDARPAMFPSPELTVAESRVDIWAGHPGSTTGPGAPCLESGAEWTARFSRVFLEAGADQMLAEAPTTPGISSAVDIEWYPDQVRLRTTLVFAGPLDIPNGTCWIDDTLSVTDGSVGASGEQGVKTSLFAEGACGRFFDHLPDGGAGEQAITLLPAAVELGDGAVLHFVADEVIVRDDAVVVAGSFRRD